MDERPIREIQPLPVPAQFLVLGPLVSTAAGLFLGFAGFVTSNLVLMSSGSPVLIYGVIVFVLAFSAAMVLCYLKTFIEPGRTIYRVYADRIEYEEGLLARHRRTLVFDQVIDVSVAEGLLQQTRAVGTITLVTQQLMSAGEGQLSNRHISLGNVPDPQGVYDLIRSLAI